MCVHPSIHPHTHTHICTYVHTYIHTYMHTYIHVYSLLKTWNFLFCNYFSFAIITLNEQELCCNSCYYVRVLRRNCLLKQVEIEGKIEVTGRRGRRCNQLVDYLKETRGYWKMEEEELELSVRRTRLEKAMYPS